MLDCSLWSFFEFEQPNNKLHIIPITIPNKQTLFFILLSPISLENVIIKSDKLSLCTFFFCWHSYNNNKSPPIPYENIIALLFKIINNSHIPFLYPLVFNRPFKAVWLEDCFSANIIVTASIPSDPFFVFLQDTNRVITWSIVYTDYLNIPEGLIYYTVKALPEKLRGIIYTEQNGYKRLHALPSFTFRDQYFLLISGLWLYISVITHTAL